MPPAHRMLPAPALAHTPPHRSFMLACMLCAVTDALRVRGGAGAGTGNGEVPICGTWVDVRLEPKFRVPVSAAPFRPPRAASLRTPSTIGVSKGSVFARWQAQYESLPGDRRRLAVERLIPGEWCAAHWGVRRACVRACVRACLRGRAGVWVLRAYAGVRSCV